MAPEPKPEWADRAAFPANRAAFPPEGLEQYRGQLIAWAPDGTRIVASATSFEGLVQRVREAGEDPHSCVMSSVPEEDVVMSAFTNGVGF